MGIRWDHSSQKPFCPSGFDPRRSFCFIARTKPGDASRGNARFQGLTPSTCCFHFDTRSSSGSESVRCQNELPLFRVGAAYGADGGLEEVSNSQSSFSTLGCRTAAVDFTPMPGRIRIPSAPRVGHRSAQGSSLNLKIYQIRRNVIGPSGTFHQSPAQSAGMSFHRKTSVLQGRFMLAARR